MNMEKTLQDRSGAKCELCESSEKLQVYSVTPQRMNSAEESAMICEPCLSQIENKIPVNPNHWHCLNTSIWSEVPSVKVIAWRMLNRLKNEGWAQDLLDQLYLDDETFKWAKAGLPIEKKAEEQIKHIDSNGTLLQNGDTVVLIKDLDVKGGGFTAKRGTAVRNISLVEDNPEQIMGKVNGSQIVLLVKFVKKSN